MESGLKLRGTAKTQTAQKTAAKKFEIYGLSLPAFAICAVIVLTATFLGVLPGGMIGAFPLMIVLGAILSLIGNHTPIVKTYLGGGAIVCVFGASAIVYFNLLPEAAIATMDTFVRGGGFLDFYIAALITGSILGMNRKLLIKAAVRYLPAIIGGILVALAFVAVAGALTGFGWYQALLFVGVPIMGGGMGAGAVPLATIFGEGTGMDPAEALSMMVPAVALGNAFAIVCGGVLNKIGKNNKKLSGQGQLMISKDENKAAISIETGTGKKKEKSSLNLNHLGTGLAVATSFFVFGNIVGHFLPGIHPYAWMILSVAAAKIFNLIPERIENCCFQWFQFIMKNLTEVLLIGVGIAFTDLGQIISAITPVYLVLIAATIIGAIIGSGFIGRLVGFYPVESSITAGLCMANMGGTGDVAVLSASDRMELMPFAQISSRLGGAFMLILASILLQVLGI